MRRDEQPPDDIAAHAAMTPPGETVDVPMPDDALGERPGEDLLGSEGEDLLPRAEEIHKDAAETPLPIDEMAFSGLHEAGDGSMMATEGELQRQLEDLFPLVWLAMLMTVCYIALYFAIDQLPNRSNPLPGPGMFF